MGMFDDLIPQQQQEASLPPPENPTHKPITFTDLIPQKAATAPVPPSTWGDVASQAAQNAPASAGSFVSGIGQMVMHPLDTVNNMTDVGAGGIANAINMALPNSMQIKRTPEMDKASAVGKFYADRYGSEEGFKKALAADPVGVMADISTVFGGGELAAAKVLGEASTAAKVLGTASRSTNPLSGPALLAKGAARGTGATVKAALGLTTGTSADTIGQAVEAGRQGGDYGKAFTQHMRGSGDVYGLLDQAKQAVQNIADQRNRDYQQGIQTTIHDAMPLDVKPVIDKFVQLKTGLFRNGFRMASDETMRKMNDIADVLKEFVQTPQAHNAGGFDALKRRIDELMPSAIDPGNSGRVVTDMRNFVKDFVVKQVPEYAGTMKNYEEAKNLQTEIERSLSLGKNAAADTALRKLLSITRNNANTNYGNRLQSAEILAHNGAPNLLPGLAGQSLNTIVPRGLAGKLLSGGAAYGALTNPAFLAALPLTSPRLVGEAARLAGIAKRLVGKIPTPTVGQVRTFGAIGSYLNPQSGSQQ